MICIKLDANCFATRKVDVVEPFNNETPLLKTLITMFSTSHLYMYVHTVLYVTTYFTGFFGLSDGKYPNYGEFIIYIRKV
jgi:hypothetical protein